MPFFVFLALPAFDRGIKTQSAISQKSTLEQSQLALMNVSRKPDCATACGPNAKLCICQNLNSSDILAELSSTVTSKHLKGHFRRSEQGSRPHRL